MKKYQCCPVCNGYGKQPGYYDPIYGFFNSVVTCAKCNGEMVIETPPGEEPVPEIEIVKFWKRMGISSSILFFAAIVILLIADHYHLLCQ